MLLVISTVLGLLLSVKIQDRVAGLILALAHTALRAASEKDDSLRTAMTSHEICTPKNGILGMTALALDTLFTEKQRVYPTLVKSSADSLLSLLDNILDLAKIEFGKLDFQKIFFSLPDSLGKLRKSLGQWAFSKGLELARRIRPEVPEWLLGDPARLSQVLVNLVANGIKFTDKGEVVVDICRREEAEAGVLLHFLVLDTGIGIPESQRCRLFDPFTQADGSTTRKYGGSGLGLAIAKYLVESMNGRIWVESQEGSGSTFTETKTPALAPVEPQPSAPIAAFLDNFPAKAIAPLEPSQMPGCPPTSGVERDDPLSEPRNNPPFDPDALLGRLEGDRELLAELADLVEVEAAKLLVEARDALAQGDFASLQRAAHTLKGAVANFGAVPAFHAAQELEAAAHEGLAPPALDAYAAFEREMKRLLASLKPYHAETSG